MHKISTSLWDKWTDNFCIKTKFKWKYGKVMDGNAVKWLAGLFPCQSRRQHTHLSSLNLYIQTGDIKKEISEYSSKETWWMQMFPYRTQGQPEGIYDKEHCSGGSKWNNTSLTHKVRFSCVTHQYITFLNEGPGACTINEARCVGSPAFYGLNSGSLCITNLAHF